MPDQEPIKRIVRSGEIELAVFERGDPNGPTVVLVHGYPDSHHVWNAVVPYLADSCHVVTYDVRGSGESTIPPNKRGYSITNLVTDLFAVIDTMSPGKPVHLVGHDWGSVQAWEAVCESDADTRIASYTSISGPNLDHVGYWIRERLTRPTPHNLRQLIRQLISSLYVLSLQLPILPELMVRAIVRFTGWQRPYRALVSRTERIRPDQICLGRTCAQDLINGIHLYRVNVRQRILRPRERRTTIPVQLIINIRDPFTLPALFESEQQWMSRLRRREINSGHWPQFSQPELLAKLVVELIDTVG